jgi:hypothetical protein
VASDGSEDRRKRRANLTEPNLARGSPTTSNVAARRPSSERLEASVGLTGSKVQVGREVIGVGRYARAMGNKHDDHRPSSDPEAIEFLVSRVPALRPTLAEHVADNDEVLSYLAFADFNRWFCAGVRAGHSEAELRAFVDAVEVLLTTDIEPPAYDSVWNLAAVCTEDSDWIDTDVMARIEDWLGPATLDSLKPYLPARRADN